MGKKPVLGLVSALCVGLALTGCDSTRSSMWHSDGTPAPKYQTQSTFGKNSTDPAVKGSAWRESPPIPSKPTTVGDATQTAKPVDSNLPPMGDHAPYRSPSGVQQTGWSNNVPQ